MRHFFVHLFSAGLLLANLGARADSIISDPQFDQDTKHVGWPDGWGVKTSGNGKTWETENGTHFLRLVSQEKGQLQVLYRELKVRPGELKGFTLAVHYRLSDLVAGERPFGHAEAIILFFNSAGNLLEPSPPPLVFSGPSAVWNDVSQKLAVPAATSRIVLIAGLVNANAGTLDIAGLSGIPLDDAEAQAVAAAQYAASPAPEASISNGDFQAADTSGNWPADWGSPQAGMSWQTEDNFHFVRIVSQQPDKSIMLGRTIPLPVGAPGIMLTIRYRCSGVQHGDHEWFDARTIVHFLGAAGGAPLANEGRDLDTVFTHKPADTGWVERARFLTVPVGATEISLRAGLFQARAGTVDLAKIQVTPVTEATTRLMQLAGAAYGSWKGDENAALDRRAEAQLEAQLVATNNLVPNSSFSAATKNSAWPDGWGNGALPGLTWETEKESHFMRLAAQTPPRTVMLYKMILLNNGVKAVDVSFRYRLIGLVKGEIPPGDARTPLHFLDGTRVGHLENGKVLGPDLPDLVFPSTGADWAVVQRRLTVPDGATKLQLMPALWGAKAGTLDIADIHVTPLVGSGTTAPAP